jgi:tetratricopeptide (TPR) repeat protein
MTGASKGAQLQLIVSLASAGDFEAAVAQLAGLEDKTARIDAWSAISRVNANMQRLDLAIFAIENALQLDPESPGLQLERVALLEKQGRHDEALGPLERLALGPHGSPQLLVHLGRALEYANRPDDAEACIEAALDRWPIDAALHALLAELRWSRGEGPALTAKLERAIQAYPGELKLRLVAADALRNAGFPERALALLMEGLRRAPSSAAFLTSIGVLLDSLDRPSEALPYLQAAVRHGPGSIAAQRNLIPTLLRLRETREALRVCDSLLTHLPDDQQLIAWRATALRLLADGEYLQLHDYRRLVRTYRLSPRRGTLEEFNQAFARELTALHLRERRPLAQSLRGGSQTERNLPTDNPLIAEFFAMLDEPIRDYIERLTELDSRHPTARRRRADGAYRISGSWSVQLQPGGFHVNHVHPAGWLSSAYYVELPQAAGVDPRAGWLAFGEPGIALQGLGAEHFVRPEPGLLVLFPSYLWHGTVPFTQGGRRLTAAFDVVPA